MPNSAVSSEVKSAIRGQIAKGIVAAIIGLLTIAAIGWWFYLEKKIITVVSGVPPGAVVAFSSHEKCPDGWRDFATANGRVIVGAGQGDGLTSREVGDKGGAESHKLTIPELPSHDHSFTYYSTRGGGGRYAPAHVIAGSGDLTKNTDATGGNQSFETMPPFVALKYCIKQGLIEAK